MKDEKREKIERLILFLILLISYGYFFPRWADPNQNSRLDMIVALVEDGTFQIDKYVENTVDYAKVGDHYYSDKAPGAAFLGLPFYAGLKLALDLPVIAPLMERLAGNEAFRATLRAEGSGIFEQKVRFALAQVVLAFFVGALPSALIGLMLYNLLTLLIGKSWLRAAVVLIYGLLTPAFAYANAFYGHQLCAALLLGAFYILATREQPAAPSLLLVGFLLGYSVITEYPAFLAAGVLFFYCLYRLWRRRRLPQIGWVILPAAILAGGWMAYNTYIFGGPLNLGYSYSELWTTQHSAGFMSLSLPSWEAAWGVTFSPFRGLFFLSPVLLFSLPGLVIWQRSGRYLAELWTAAACILAFFLFNISSVMWWGGFAVGPRYLLPALPFLALPLGFALRECRRRSWLRGLGWLLALWSLVATWGLTLAEQAYPSDTLRNPLVEHALPNWLAGNIARNVGTVLGFSGVGSLLPLLLVLGLLLFLLVKCNPSPPAPNRYSEGSS